MDDSTPSVRDAGVRRMLLRIAVEILVGFVGVYAAFALTAYHERQAAVERRHQLKRALIVEVAFLDDIMHRNLTYDSILVAFDSAMKAGKRPIPRSFAQPTAVRTDIWDAIKLSGGLSLLDVPTFSLAANFYSSVGGLLETYAQLRDVSTRIILPNRDRGPDAFYDAKTGRLRSDVADVYYFDMRVAGNYAKTAVVQGDSLLKILGRDTL
jgi:hypothetical protein